MTLRFDSDGRRLPVTVEKNKRLAFGGGIDLAIWHACLRLKNALTRCFNEDIIGYFGVPGVPHTNFGEGAGEINNAKQRQRF